MKIKDFSKRIAFIFGGSTGIGLETAKLLAKLGANVIIFARTEEKLKLATSEIEACKIADQRVGYKVLDVSNYEHVKEVVTLAVKDFGIPHLVINCAGRAIPHPFVNITFEQMDETMHVNFYGIWNTCAVLVPFMKQNGGGHIVNTSSFLGLVGIYGYADYSASKFAIIGFSDTLRYELKPDNISISVLCPADVDTPGYKTENLTKPGETIAISGTAKILTPQVVAQKVIKGIQKQEKIIIPSSDGKFLYWLKRVFPILQDVVIEGAIAKYRKTHTNP